MTPLVLNTALQPVCMLDLSREYSTQRLELLEAITAVCDAQRFILGPEVDRFEAAAAAACGVPFAIGCGSGTDALWLALMALGLGAGDAVLTTPFSFFSTASSILRAGATPIFADIDPDTFNLSAAGVGDLLGRAGGARLTAIMPVHLFGQCADMDSLGVLARRQGLRVVEDAAQAFGAAWNGVSAGAMGDAAAFSFYPTKNLSAFGDAGLVTTRDAALEERVRMLRVHGMRRRYFHDEVGWNSRLDTMQAAVLEIKLRHLENGNGRRRELAALYNEGFLAAGLPGPVSDGGIVLPAVAPGATPIFNQYVIRAPRRDELRAFLAAHGIGSEIYYPLPLHLQESLRMLGYRRGEFPVSERAADEVLALPMYPHLRPDEVETVIEAVRRFLRA